MTAPKPDAYRTPEGGVVLAEDLTGVQQNTALMYDWTPLWLHTSPPVPEPTPEPQEPLDPAARVMDSDGFEWALRSDGYWCPLTSEDGAVLEWGELSRLRGPLTVIHPGWSGDLR